MNQNTLESQQCFQDLLTSLVAEVEVYEKLLELYERKQKAVVANDLDALRAVVHKEPVMLQRAERLALQRELRVRAVSAMMNTMDSTPTLGEIIDIAPVQLRTRLKELRQQLRANVVQITRANRQNEFLINSALEMTTSMIDTLLREKEITTSTIYQGNGETTAKDTGQRMIDYQI